MLQPPAKEYSGPRGVGIRMTEPLTPGMGGAYSETGADLLEAYHLFDKAHLVMLGEEDLIPREAAARMLAALREMERDGAVDVRRQVGGGMHSGEQYLVRRLGYDIGGRIHLGRSTGDFGAVSRRVRERTRLLELAGAVNTLRAALLDTAEAHLDTVMPGHTGSQHAQPTTFGHQLLAWVAALDRQFEGIAQAFARVNRSPAGAAILTGSSFAVNRQRTADLMGFEGVLRNTLDAIQGHDDELDALSVAVSVNVCLARWANDINFWSTSESGYLRVPDRFCGTSSIMAQKRNPAMLPAMRTAAAEALGAFATTAAALNAPSGDFGGDGGAGLHRTFDAAVRGAAWLAELVPALEVDRERMLDAAGAHWAQATDVAAALVESQGWPWRVAHQVTAILVRLSEERRVPPREVTPALLDEAAVLYLGEPVGLSEDALRDALDPARFVERRTLYGGPSPEAARDELAEERDHLGRDVAWLDAATERLREAEARLESAIDALVAEIGA
ncbi:MAG: argininosuccinate lyase [Dehalococcoidia bacterium]|nr:argininosuccinate lyase [Dehalococcoidia bacterium]